MYMGISHGDFMNTTPYEFSVALKLYRRKLDQKETEVRYRYQFDRLMAIASLNQQAKHPIRDASKFFELYWEKGEGKEAMFDDINEVDVNAMFNLNQKKEDGGK